MHKEQCRIILQEAATCFSEIRADLQLCNRYCLINKENSRQLSWQQRMRNWKQKKKWNAYSKRNGRGTRLRMFRYTCNWSRKYPLSSSRLFRFVWGMFQPPKPHLLPLWQLTAVFVIESVRSITYLNISL